MGEKEQQNEEHQVQPGASVSITEGRLGHMTVGMMRVS